MKEKKNQSNFYQSVVVMFAFESWQLWPDSITNDPASEAARNCAQTRVDGGLTFFFISCFFFFNYNTCFIAAPRRGVYIIYLRREVGWRKEYVSV